MGAISRFFSKRWTMPIVLLIVALSTVLYPLAGIRLGQIGKSFLTFIVSIVIAALIIFYYGEKNR